MNEKIKTAATILQKHGASTVKIFGSYARGEENADSDLDILVEFSERKSLLVLVGIEQELEEKLGIKVDLITPKAVNSYLVDEIEKDAVLVA